MGDVQTLAAVVRDARQRRDLSLSAAARQLGITKSYLWEIEDGRQLNPTLAVAVRMRRGFGLSAKVLLDAAEVSHG